MNLVFFAFVSFSLSLSRALSLFLPSRDTRDISCLIRSCFDFALIFLVFCVLNLNASPPLTS
jgi:hypothetical protein